MFQEEIENLKYWAVVQVHEYSGWRYADGVCRVIGIYIGGRTSGQDVCIMVGELGARCYPMFEQYVDLSLVGGGTGSQVQWAKVC